MITKQDVLVGGVKLDGVPFLDVKKGDQGIWRKHNSESGFGIVAHQWWYDGQVVDVLTMDGRKIALHPDLGDDFERTI